MADIQSNQLKTQFREVGSSTWLTLNCETDNNETLTNEVSEVDSKCGPHVGIKPAKAEVSGNAIYDIEADGSTTVSYEQMRNWQLNRTELECLIENIAFTSNGASYTEADIVHHFYTGWVISTVK